jgi:hypothetical protein
MIKMPQTTYKDLSEMINFFGIIRLTNATGFLNYMFGNQITRLFSRSGRKVDADFAQSSAINSQIGVIPFDADFYATSGNTFGTTGVDFPVIAASFNGTVPAAAGGGNANMIMMGIYFSSSTEDMQIRDYITPGRVIRYDTGLNKFVYDYTPIKSQVVPNYKWRINAGDTIFGSQTNEWSTDGISINNNFHNNNNTHSSTSIYLISAPSGSLVVPSGSLDPIYWQTNKRSPSLRAIGTRLKGIGFPKSLVNSCAVGL